MRVNESKAWGKNLYTGSRSRLAPAGCGAEHDRFRRPILLVPFSANANEDHSDIRLSDVARDLVNDPAAWDARDLRVATTAKRLMYVGELCGAVSRFGNDVTTCWLLGFMRIRTGDKIEDEIAGRPDKEAQGETIERK